MVFLSLFYCHLKDRIMAAKIRVLDEQTINQIAAGEVIENPASVVKELVENAIDACADDIIIEILGSGHQLIRVQDNGSGMTQDEVLLCLERHATSKLNSFSDIFSLKTMGFRGEAIPSIASVSEMTIITSPRLFEKELLQDATVVEVHGGKIKSCSRTQCFSGTTIEVRSLFYNTPARKKFQKSQAKDAQDITKMVNQLALAHPEVGFKLILNGSQQLYVEKASWDRLSDRVGSIIGRSLFSKMKYVFKTVHGVTIVGYIHDESGSFSNRNYQYFFVNQRPIVSLALSFAVKNSYGSLIDPQRHPACVLYLQFPEDTIDVNVHPQKKEVRFHEEDKVRAAVIEAVSAALYPSIHKSWDLGDPSQAVFESANSVIDYKSIDPERPILCEKIAPTKQVEALVYEMPLNTFRLVGIFREYVLVEMQWADDLKKNAPAELHEEGILFVNVGRGLSRVAYEDLMQQGQRGAKIIESQSLLIPVFIELQHQEAAFLLKMIPYLYNLGFSVREFGSNCFLIEAIPPAFTQLASNELKEFILKIVDGAEVGSFHPEQEARRVAILASKSYRLQNSVSDDFARKFINRLLSCSHPFICPFGKAVFATISETELLKKFS